MPSLLFEAALDVAAVGEHVAYRTMGGTQFTSIVFKSTWLA
jgi:hypothetical protein